MRLVAFGCSNTYGHGLRDCIAKDKKDCGSYPSKFAWPQLLADKMNLECVNMGVPGASNKEIWHTAVNFPFEPTDKVVFLWSYIDRYCVIKKDDVHPFGVWNKDKSTKMYYRHVHDNYDSCTDFHIRSNHIKLYLDAKQIFNLHGIINRSHVLYTPEWNSVDLIKVHMAEIKKMFEPAIDGIHPGELAHKHFANELFKIINN